MKTTRTNKQIQQGKNLPGMQETWVWFLGWEDPLEEGMATHSNILVWRIPMVRRAWRATGHYVAELDMTVQLSMTQYTAGYKINMQKPIAFLYANNEISGKKTTLRCISFLGVMINSDAKGNSLWFTYKYRKKNLYVCCIFLFQSSPIKS